MKKRWMALLAVVMAFIMVTSACSKKEASTSEATSSTEEQSSEETAEESSVEESSEASEESSEAIEGPDMETINAGLSTTMGEIGKEAEASEESGSEEPEEAFTGTRLETSINFVRGGLLPEIVEVDPETLLTDYSMVFQDVVLFDDTVMENIRLGRYGATDEEVIEAAKAANCDEFVEKLPNGYDTQIGENGAKLSGGERQRISIARALLKNAPIVLLDEATASLDVENETKVQGALSKLLQNKTVLVIAHRMRTVEAADKIIVLKDGMVAEQGKPEDLMNTGGEFAKMVNLQSESAKWAVAGTVTNKR